MAHLNVEHEIVIKKDIDNVINVLVDLFNQTPEKELKNIQKQGFALENFEQFLIKLMTHDVLPTREERFAVAKLLHKIQSRREAIALMNGEIDMEEIKRTSKSLGKRMAMPENEPFGISVSKR
jgi:hypothetical protein